MEISDGNRTLFLHNLVKFIQVQVLRFVLYLRCEKKVSVSAGV